MMVGASSGGTVDAAMVMTIATWQQRRCLGYYRALQAESALAMGISERIAPRGGSGFRVWGVFFSTLNMMPRFSRTRRSAGSCPVPSNEGHEEVFSTPTSQQRIA